MVQPTPYTAQPVQATEQEIPLVKPRVSSIDLVRGIVMVIMVLDHVRHFMHADALVYEPTDLTKTTPVLFFTRWITHFCAPAFVLLAGMAIRISAQRKPLPELRIFLITRGLWLILIEVVVMRFSFLFNLYFDLIFFQVIWAIGASMVMLGLLVRYRERFIVAVCVLLIGGHNIVSNLTISATHPLYVPWTLFLKPGMISLTESSRVLVLYPMLPWLGVLLLGYLTGKWFTPEFSSRRRRYLLFAGTSLVLCFILLRSLNLYGDPADWTIQKTPLFTLMSFLNCQKYPPSLLYLMMTLGPVYLALAILDRASVAKTHPLIIFGRVPLFFYIIHFFMIHIVALITYMNIAGKSWNDINFSGMASFGGITPGVGVSLPFVYLAWAGFVIVLYPLCQWYNVVKMRSKHWIISYI